MGTSSHAAAARAEAEAAEAALARTRELLDASQASEHAIRSELHEAQSLSQAVERAHVRDRAAAALAIGAVSELSSCVVALSASLEEAEA